MRRYACILAATLLLGLHVVAQPANPTQPPGYDYKPGFWEILKEFEDFWEKKTPQPGQGYKVFKRWEDYTFRRMQANGLMPDASKTIWEEINKNKAPNAAEKQMQETCTTGASWTELGPKNICINDARRGHGRLNFIRFFPETGVPTKVFVGAPGGGVWFKDLTNATATWQPITDFNLSYAGSPVDVSVLGVSDLLIKPTDPNTMYLATGDRTGISGAADLNPYSIGILKTTDGGANWEPMDGLGIAGQNNGVRIYKLLMNPNNSEQLFAATSKGIYKKEAGGNNWALWMLANKIVYDIEFKPDNSNIIYASTSESIFRFTFSTVTNSWSSANFLTSAVIPSVRIELAVIAGSTGNNANKLYAIAAGDPSAISSSPGLYGVYRTINATAGVFSLTKIYGNTGQHNLLSRDYAAPYDAGGGQGLYDLAIIADPADASGNTIYIGGINLYRLKVSGSAAADVVPQDNVKLISYWTGGSPTGANLPMTEKNTNTDGNILSTSPTIERVNFGATGAMNGCTDDPSNLCKYTYHTFTTTSTTLTITSSNPNTFLSLYYPTPPSTGVWTNPCTTIFQAATSATPNTLTVNGLSIGSQHTIVVSTKNSTIAVPQYYELTFSVPVIGYSGFSSCYAPISSYIHADIHALATANGKLYAGSDGGIYEATIPTTGSPDEFWWTDLSKGLGITQYFGMSNIGDLVVAGAQDNGVSKINSASLKRWDLIYGGDGVECIIDPNSSNQTIYATVNGGVERSTNGGTTFSTLVCANTPGVACPPSLLSVNEQSKVIHRAIAFAPNTITPKLYVGFQGVYRINTPAGANPTKTPIATPAQIAGAGTVIDLIRLSSDGNTMFVVKYASITMGRRNADDTWTWQNVTNIPSFGQITDLAIKNSTTFYYTVSGYDVNHKVYKVVKDGANFTFTNMAFDLPNLPVNAIVYDAAANVGGAVDRLFVGTDVGVYYTQNCTKQHWVRFKGATNATNLPNVTISELEIAGIGSTRKLRAATYGRGIWETPINSTNTSCPCACTNSAPTLQDADGNMTIATCVNNLTSNGFTVCLDNAAVSDPDNDLMIVAIESATLPIVPFGNICSNGQCANICLTLDLTPATM